MAIRTRDNFNYRGILPNFDRDFIEDKDSFNDWIDYPESHLVYAKKLKKWYWLDRETYNLTEVNLSGSSSSSTTTNGIPIYSLSEINLMTANNSLPDRYIVIPTPLDANAAVLNGVYETSKNGAIINLLFENIRHLQSEIAKLKNTFYYGICSLNEGNTTSNHIILDDDDEVLEPLWALDPEDLSEVTELSIDINSSNTLEGNRSYTDNNNFIEVINANTPDDISSNSTLQEINPAKILFYSTIDAKSNFLFHVNISNSLALQVEKLNGINPGNKYNILFVYSQAPRKYYWISITDENRNVVYLKYFNSTLQECIDEPNDSNVNLFKSISLQNLDLYLLNFYTKDRSYNEVDLPNLIPSPEDFVFRPAHITVRSVSDYDTLQKVSSRLLDNELIICNKTLYTKQNNKIFPLSGGNGESSIQIPTLTITNSEDSLLVGDTLQLTFNTNSNGVITYTTSDSMVATISSSGLITAINEGLVSITILIAAAGDFSEISKSITLNITSDWQFGDTFPIIFY